MSETFRRQMRALATLVGTIIGAGIFGVPFVISRAGLAAGIMYFVLLGLVTTILHWYYGQIVLAIPERHRFPGFAGLLGGATGRTLAAILGVLGGWLAITAYLILGGAFLNIIFGSVFGGTELVWSLVFALLGVLAVSGGLSRVSRSEIPLTLLLIGLLLFFVFRGLPLVDLSEIWSGSSQYFFLPYGVILFSLSGLAVIPELEDILGNGQRSALRRVIFAGTALATVLTALFGIVMAGVTGPETTKDAISGLLPVLGPWIVGAGALFGFLAVITSYFVFLMNQIETFSMDFGANVWIARGLSLLVPLALFLLGARDFIPVIGLAGGVTGGLTGVLLMALYGKLLEKQRARPSRWIIPVAIGIFFLVGAVAEVLTFMRF